MASNQYFRLCSQVVFLSLSYATVYLVYMRFRNTYDSENDTFRVEFLLVPVIGLSFLENYAFTPLEVKQKSTQTVSVDHSRLINMQLEGFRVSLSPVLFMLHL